MRELWLEGKKYLFTFKMALLILVLFFLNIMKLFYFNYYDGMMTDRKTIRSDKYLEQYRVQYEGKMTETKAKKLITQADSYEKFLISGGGKENKQEHAAYLLRDSVQRQYNYHLTMGQLLKKIKHVRKVYERKHNTYEVKKCNRMITCYENRYLQNYYDCQDFKRLLEYNFSTCLLLIAGLFVSFTFYYQEKMGGTYPMIKVSGKNQKRIMRNKMLCSILFLLFIAILLYASDVAVYAKFLHLRGWLQPVYAIEGYEYNVSGHSILFYYMMQRLLCVLLCVVTTWIAAIAADAIWYGKYTVVLTVVLFAAAIYFGDFIYVPDRYFANYEWIRIQNVPVHSYEIYLFLIFICSVITGMRMLKRGNKC